MKVEDRIKKAHVAIMGHKKWCGYSALLACGKVTVSDALPTARTDGYNVEYGRKFIDSLNERQTRFVVLHESSHKAYRHLHIYRDLWEEDAKLANVAMDTFINLALMDADAGEGFIEMPPVGIKPDPQFRGWSTKQIFDFLKKEQEQSDGDGEGDGEGNEPSDGSDGSQGGKGNELSDGESGGNEGGIDEHDWENAQSTDKTTKDAQEREIERAIRHGETLRKKMQGKGAGDSEGMFGELMRPKINWRGVLRQFLTATCTSVGESTWARPNRRVLASGDTYMPGEIGKTARHLVMVFDTSGSCFGTEEMTAFVSQIAHITKQLKPKLVTVLYVDYVVQGSQQFRNGQIAVQSMKPVGGGGTDMTKGFAWCTENRVRPDAMVIFTDMYTPFGQPPGYPVLWAATTDIKAPWGTTIQIEI